MARIEQLVDLVADDALRQELAAEVATLKRRQQFGLLFERHIPETTLLPNAPIRVGSTVVKRRDSKDTPRRVLEVRGEELVVAPIPAGETRAPRRGQTAAGEPETVARADVLVKKTFGETVYPALTSVGRVERGGDKPFHAVIEGENYHALELLAFALENQVDCIFLDPPYNTGARDWKYNNDYVDENDAWRHSKWLAFMEKRLRLAKRLLRSDGVLIVTIDEHELHHLGMLLEQVFPEYLRYVVSIVVNSRGSTGTRNFGTIEEYAIFVVPDLGYDVIQPREGSIDGLMTRAPSGSFDLGEDDDGADRDEGEDDDHEPVDVESEGEVPPSNVYWRGAVRTGQGTSFRTQRPRQFFPLLIDPGDHTDILVGAALTDRDGHGNLVPPSWDPVDGRIPIWPVDEDGGERVWCYEPGRMANEIALANIRVGRFNPVRNTYAVNVRRVRRTERRFRERTIWWEQSYDAGSNGTNVLKKLLGVSGAFPFPKSVYAVRDALATVVGGRPDALIVDFFAGSGTTLHSTCLLNLIDGGRRKCILVTNNDVDAATADALDALGLYRGDAEYEREGIFEKVTMPRVIAAIQGRRPDGAVISGRYKWAGGRPYSEGFAENAEFFRLDYLDPIELELGRGFDQLLPSLWLSAGSRGKRDGIDPAADFSVATDGPYAFLTRPSGVEGLLAALTTREDVTHVFVLTDSEDAFSELAEQFPATLTVQMLPRDYLRSFTNGRDSAG